MRQKRRSYRGSDDDEDAIGEDLAAVNERLDALTRQLERVVQSNAAPRAGAGGTDERANRVSDALARLDRRLDQVISKEDAPQTSFQHRARYAPPPPPAPPQSRARSSAPRWPRPAAVPRTGPRRFPRASARLMAGPPPCAGRSRSGGERGGGRTSAAMEQQLHQINSQISSLHQPYENALGACAVTSPRSAGP